MFARTLTRSRKNAPMFFGQRTYVKSSTHVCVLPDARMCPHAMYMIIFLPFPISILLTDYSSNKYLCSSQSDSIK